MRSPMNISSTGAKYSANRITRNLSAGQLAYPKDGKATANTANPPIMKRLGSMVSLGKSQPESPAPYCAIAQTMSGSDTANDHSSSYQSSGSYTSSNSSSSSSSSSFSSWNNQTDGQHQGQQTPAPAQTSASAADGGPSSASPPPPPSEQSADDDDKLPTNADYYPLAQSETQSNEDYNDSEQYDVESAIDAEKHKELWANLMNAPQHIVTKLKKFHADFKGTGALYGSDHFAPQPQQKA